MLERIARGHLVARERELHEARALWQQAADGQEQVLLISGEPGVGKTRLMRELAAQAAVSGGTVLTGECYAEGGAPYAPISQIIQQAVDGRSPVELGLPEFVLADLITLAPVLRARHPGDAPNPPVDPQAEQQRLSESIVAAVLGALRARAGAARARGCPLGRRRHAVAAAPPRAPVASAGPAPADRADLPRGGAGRGTRAQRSAARPRPRAPGDAHQADAPDARPDRRAAGGALPGGDHARVPGRDLPRDGGQSVLRRRSVQGADRAGRADAPGRALAAAEHGRGPGAAERARGDPGPPGQAAGGRPGDAAAGVDHRPRVRRRRPAPGVRPGRGPSDRRPGGGRARPVDRRVASAGRAAVGLAALHLHPRPDPAHPGGSRQRAAGAAASPSGGARRSSAWAPTGSTSWRRASGGTTPRPGSGTRRPSICCGRATRPTSSTPIRRRSRITRRRSAFCASARIATGKRAP